EYKWKLRRETKKNEELKETNRALRSENVELKRENQGLKKENHLLFQTLERLKQMYQEKVPEIKRMIGFVKAELIDKAKDKWLTKNLFKDKEEVQGAEEFLKIKEEKRKERPKKVRRKRKDQEIER
ncbi:plasmid recombination protein, partial [Priestia filamentosa]